MRWEVGSVAWGELWWLLAIAPVALVLAYYYLRSLDQHSPFRRRLSLVLRSLFILCLILALVSPSWLAPSESLCVVVAVDRSDSALDRDTPGQPTTKQADDYLRRATARPHDALLLGLAFAANQGPAGPVTPAGVPPTTQLDSYGTDLAGAIRAAAAAVPPGYAPRLALLTDGIPTTGDVLQAALRAGMPIDVVVTQTSRTAEVQVVPNLKAPAEVRPGEGFKLEVEVLANHQDGGELVWYRDGREVHAERVALRDGVNRFTSPEQRTAASGILRYRAELRGLGNDFYRDNNSGSAVVWCSGKPRVLIVASRERQAADLADALAQAQFEVAPIRPVESLPGSVNELTDYDLLVLVNVPLTDPLKPVPPGKLEAIRNYVQGLGGGLLVVGGDQSFSLGGYGRSPLEELLPVSSSFERNKDKPQLAMVLVMDRSGSMASGNKISLAREAAQVTVTALGPRDLIGVISFDTQQEWTCDLRMCSDKPDVINRIEAVSADGGTLILPALEEAVAKLETMGQGAKHRHIILLTDGKDNNTTAAAPFEALATRAVSKGITVSAVAVGPDADQELLASMAEKGRGRFYHTNDPADLPKFFQKEAAEAARDAFQHNDTFARPKLLTPVIEGLDWENAPALSAYVRTKIKVGADHVLWTDVHFDPLLAWWRTGLGRAAAFTSGADTTMAGRWLTNWRGGYAKFWAQLARYLQRSPEAKGMSLRLSEENGVGTFVVDVVEPLSGAFINEAVCQALVVPDRKEPAPAVVTQTAPGRYRGTFACREPGHYLVRVGLRTPAGQELQMTRHLTVGFPPEHQLRSPDLALMQEVARRTGGRYNPSAEELLAPPTQLGTKTYPLWPILLAAAAVLLIVDVASRRLHSFGSAAAIRSTS